MRRTRAWRRNQAERNGRKRQTQLTFGTSTSSLEYARTTPCHVWHKRTPFNCGNPGCMACSHAMRGKELRAYRYRRGEVPTVDTEPLYPMPSPMPWEWHWSDFDPINEWRTLAEEFGLDERDTAWINGDGLERDYEGDRDDDYDSYEYDDGLSDDWMHEHRDDPYYMRSHYRWQQLPDMLGDELWIEHEQQSGFWDSAWNEGNGPMPYRGMIADLAAMLDPKADESMMYLEDEDAA